MLHITELAEGALTLPDHFLRSRTQVISDPCSSHVGSEHWANVVNEILSLLGQLTLTQTQKQAILNSLNKLPDFRTDTSSFCEDKADTAEFNPTAHFCPLQYLLVQVQTSKPQPLAQPSVDCSVGRALQTHGRKCSGNVGKEWHSSPGCMAYWLVTEQVRGHNTDSRRTAVRSKGVT